VITAAAAVEELETWRCAGVSAWATGFPTIDRATGGFVRGQVWVVTSSPGQGRSTLTTQWALLLAARHRVRTDLVSAREPEHLLAARLLACAGTIPVSHLWRNELSADDDHRLEQARDIVAEAALRIAGPDRLSVFCSDSYDGDAPEALVVDDADLAAGATCERLASFAQQGTLVIVTSPRHHVIGAGGIDHDWARLADFILEVDRPDLLAPDSLRPGEADLRIRRNRWGPVLSATVVFQGHYARFVELVS